MPRLYRRPAVWLPLWLAAIAAAILFLDRPWADLAHADPLHLRAVSVPLTRLIDPLVPLGLTALLGLGAAFLAGWRPKGDWNPSLARLVLTVALAIELAMAMKNQLKHLFGRTWPETWVNHNPSWIKDGVFQFDFLHGGPGWSAFPSGHAAVMAAAAFAVLALRPGWGRLAMIPLALVCVGLLGANYHWVSDVIAGLGIGMMCGLGAAALTDRS